MEYKRTSAVHALFAMDKLNGKQLKEIREQFSKLEKEVRYGKSRSGKV